MGEDKSGPFQLSFNSSLRVFDALVQRRDDTPEHRERVAFVIRVFQPANDGTGGADEFRELFLSDASALAELEDLARNGVVGYLSLPKIPSGAQFEQQRALLANWRDK